MLSHTSRRTHSYTHPVPVTKTHIQTHFATILQIMFMLAFVFDNPFKRGPALALIIFAGLESIGGFCVGCWFFQTFFVLRDRLVDSYDS